MKQLSITASNSSSEYWRINAEFGLFLLSLIVSVSFLPWQLYEEKESTAFIEPEVIIEAIPVLYMCWLNHSTFSCVGRLSDAPVVDRNTVQSRKSGYQILVRMSQMSLLTKSELTPGGKTTSGP